MVLGLIFVIGSFPTGSVLDARIEQRPRWSGERIDRRAAVRRSTRSWNQQNIAIGRLLQTVLVRRVGQAVRIAKGLEHVAVELGKAILDARLLGHEKFALFVEAELALARPFHLVGQTQDLIEFALAAVLGGHFILPAPADVADQ